MALIAPGIFNTYFELQLGMWGCCALGVAAAWRERRLRRPEERRRQGWLGFAVAIVALAVLGAALGAASMQSAKADVAVLRNFYGVLRIKELPLPNSDFTARVLQHGTTVHGYELAEAPEVPTAYYGVNSGVGLLLRHYPRSPAISVGVAGLGVGTLATYGIWGDTFRFYEINPAVADVARKQFRYLELTRARWTIVLGDARLSLEREENQRFDVLILDAFSGDAMPVHLLTSEAFDIYLQRLKPGGVIAINISNNYLDLEPVLGGEAERAGLRACVVESHRDEQRITGSALWVLMTAPPIWVRDRRRRFPGPTGNPAGRAAAVSAPEHPLDGRLQQPVPHLEVAPRPGPHARPGEVSGTASVREAFVAYAATLSAPLKRPRRPGGPSARTESHLRAANGRPIIASAL